MFIAMWKYNTRCDPGAGRMFESLCRGRIYDLAEVGGVGGILFFYRYATSLRLIDICIKWVWIPQSRRD